VVYTGRVPTNGNIAVELPAAAGSPTSLPSVNVYVSTSANGPFLAVADGYWNEDTPWYALSYESGRLWVELQAVLAGWYYWVVVVY
jgi:hypothetical protein